MQDRIDHPVTILLPTAQDAGEDYDRVDDARLYHLIRGASKGGVAGYVGTYEGDVGWRGEGD